MFSLTDKEIRERRVAEGESKGTADDLEDKHGDRESLFAHGTKDLKPEVEEGVMRRPDRLELVGGSVVVGEAVVRARDDADELRDREDKVDELWDKEEEQRLGEVAEDARDRERHAGKVCVRVANKYCRREPVVVEQTKRGGNKRHDKEEAELVAAECVAAGSDLDGIVQCNKRTNDCALRRLEAIYASVDVDRVGAEDRNAADKHAVQNAEVQHRRQVQQRRNAARQHQVCRPVVRKQQRQRRQRRQHDLPPPAHVQHVVCKAQQQCHAH